MFAHVCCSPRVAGRSRSVTAFKLLWTILVILQNRMKFGSLEYLCGSAVYNNYNGTLYYNWSPEEKFISFYPLSPAHWGESTASAAEQDLRDCGGFSVLLWDTLANRGLNLGLSLFRVSFPNDFSPLSLLPVFPSHSLAAILLIRGEKHNLEIMYQY